jgi:hypothetical protein
MVTLYTLFTGVADVDPIIPIWIRIRKLSRFEVLYGLI